MTTGRPLPRLLAAMILAILACAALCAAPSAASAHEGHGRHGPRAAAHASPAARPAAPVRLRSGPDVPRVAVLSAARAAQDACCPDLPGCCGSFVCCAAALPAPALPVPLGRLHAALVPGDAAAPPGLGPPALRRPPRPLA